MYFGSLVIIGQFLEILHRIVSSGLNGRVPVSRPAERTLVMQINLM